MHYALIQNNIVTHVLRVPPENIFPAEVASQYRPCSESVQVGWLWQGGAFVAPPAPPVAPVSERQAAAWERIKAHRDYLSETGGYKVSVGGVDKWFHSDAKSKTQQLSLVLLGANANAVPPWKTMDGTKVTMSQNLAGQIFGAAVAQDGALFAQAEAHRAAMVASDTPETYDFSGGWPETFEE